MINNYADVPCLSLDQGNKINRCHATILYKTSVLEILSVRTIHTNTIFGLNSFLKLLKLPLLKFSKIQYLLL